MKRGEIWTAAGTGYSSKPRPVLILQSDLFGETDSVTVALLTSHAVEAPLLRVEVPLGGQTGLRVVSFVMIDKVMTVRRANVVTRIGEVPYETMLAVRRALSIFLELF